MRIYSYITVFLLGIFVLPHFSAHASSGEVLDIVEKINTTSVDTWSLLLSKEIEKRKKDREWWFIIDFQTWWVKTQTGQYSQYYSGSWIIFRWQYISKKDWYVIPHELITISFGGEEYVSVTDIYGRFQIEIEDKDLIDTIGYHISLTIGHFETSTRLFGSELIKRRIYDIRIYKWIRENWEYYLHITNLYNSIFWEWSRLFKYTEKTKRTPSLFWIQGMWFWLLVIICMIFVAFSRFKSKIDWSNI